MDNGVSLVHFEKLFGNAENNEKCERTHKKLLINTFCFRQGTKINLAAMRNRARGEILKMLRLPLLHVPARISNVCKLNNLS